MTRRQKDPLVDQCARAVRQQSFGATFGIGTAPDDKATHLREAVANISLAGNQGQQRTLARNSREYSHEGADSECRDHQVGKTSVHSDCSVLLELRKTRAM